MIRMTQGTRAFNYRIVGAAFHDGRVLLHRADNEEFWTLPGGRAELGEPATETLKREMREELSADVEIERLLWIVENFFTYMGAQWHELALYFLMSFPPDSPLHNETAPFSGYESFYEAQPEGVTLIFQWFPLSELENLTLYPSFLKSGLQALPTTPEHVVHTDPAIQGP